MIVPKSNYPNFCQHIVYYRVLKIKAFDKIYRYDYQADNKFKENGT